MKKIILLMICSAWLLVACSTKSPAEADVKQVVVQQEVQNNETVPSDSENNKALPHHLDAAHPPVDCPLRKQGLDPTKMKPFEQVEAYIQFLEREDRALWQKPEEVVNYMQLKGDERILDLGAGSGYFSFPMANKLTTGKVFAADPEPEMLRHIHHKAMLNGIHNIEIRAIDSQRPEIPEKIDIVFICDVLHHIPNLEEWMTNIVKQLPSQSKIHIIEFKQGEIPNGPPENAKIDPEHLKKIAAQSGLDFIECVQDLLPYQNYFIFQKP